MERIKKILKKTEEAGCTEEEAASAFAVASRLMAEHNLTMSDVASASAEPAATEFIDDESGFETNKWELVHNLAYAAVNEHFFVKGYFSQSGRIKKLLFFGTRENVEAAKFVFVGLLNAFDNLWFNHKARTRCHGSERRAYTVGVASGFRDKLKQQRQAMEAEKDLLSGKREGGTALALRSVQQEIERAWEAKRNPSGDNRRKSKQHSGNFAAVSGSRTTYEAGYAAGKSLNISKSIGSNGRKALG